MSVDQMGRFNSMKEAEVASCNTGIHTVTSRTKQDALGEITTRLRKCAEFQTLKAQN
ncbi:hypothetical protein MY3296_010162 [Beauveria thailandica]